MRLIELLNELQLNNEVEHYTLALLKHLASSSHEFHDNLQFRHVLFHEKTNFPILAGRAFYQIIIARVNSHQR